MSTKSGKRNKRKTEELFSTYEEMIREEKRKIGEFLDREIPIKEENESQKKLITSILKNEITICSGPAGTGKSYVTMALALGLLRAETNPFTKIYFIKSVTTLSGEEIGFIPGDLNDKIDPIMWSFKLNMEKLLPYKNIRSISDYPFFKTMPIGFIRGSSLDNTIIICDECQNISMTNARTLLTRMGKDSKMILLGDPNQIDLKNKKDSSLANLHKMFKNTKNIETIEFSNDHINVRNPIINIIENKFNEYEG